MTALTFQEPGREFPEPLAEVAVLVLDGEAHLPQDLQVPLDLPLAAPQPLGHFVRGNAEAMGLEGLQRIPLPDEWFAASRRLLSLECFEG